METKKNFPMVVNWDRYFNRKNRTVHSYMSKYGNGILSQMYMKIKAGIRTKSPYIILLKFENSDVISIVHDYHYELVLNKMLEFCISIEYYELCGKITDTLKTLNRPKRKTRKHTKSIPA